MVSIDELKEKLKNAKEIFVDCEKAIDIDGKRKELEKYTQLQSDSELYKDLAKSQFINGKVKNLTAKIDGIERKRKEIISLDELLDMMEAEFDDEIALELDEKLDSMLVEFDKLHLDTILCGQYDASNAIITLHAGAGGTEAQDWTGMLYRMYKMYCDKYDFTYRELDYESGDEAGIKSVTMEVNGDNAYGYLKAEKGIHRLVRISPFDSNARRHTSFASVEVMPQIVNDNTIIIREEDLRIDRYRSGGAGGQHVNKTESAVRITHIPTGIVVQCQNERSQIQNRETAMSVLRGKLVEKRERDNLTAAQGIMGNLKKIEWGSQIRSYVFHPYSMVKDHRTGYETSNVTAVMDGEIQGFIFDYLRKSVMKAEEDK